MERINELLGRIQELNPQELEELRDAIVAEFSKVQDTEPLTSEIVGQMKSLANAAQAVRDEDSRRDIEKTELANAAAEAAAIIGGEETKAEDEEPIAEKSSEPTSEVEDEDTDESVEKKKAPKEETKSSELSNEITEEAELSVEPLPEVVTASEKLSEQPETEDAAPEESTESVEEDPAAEEPSAEESDDEPNNETPEETVTASGLEIEVPNDHKPQVTKAAAPVTITAGADIPGVSAGSVLPGLRAVAQAIIDRRKGMGRTSGGDGEQHTVATFTTAYPDDRHLSTSDFEGNSSKVEQVVSPKALVAGGGLCAPVEVSYDIFGLGELDRPVRDSLAVFSADRGGIRFVTPPTLEDLDGAVSLWTLQDDIDSTTAGAPDPVKPCIRVTCGAEVTVYTDAVPLCLTFGNMGARAYPELVERHTQLGMVSHARFAETRLLTRIGTLSTAVTTTATPTTLGVARDLFVAVDEAAAGYRSRHRLSADTTLRAVFPAWLRNALRADLTMQLPGDGDESTFALTESKIDSWFAVRNIVVTWTLDGETGQIIGEQATGALVGFPTNLIWYLFAEGTFLFLDGGTLDLGIVRDSTLNGTNDYKIFLETFEGVAKVGVESLRVTTPLHVVGASAATQDTVA